MELEDITTLDQSDELQPDDDSNESGHTGFWTVRNIVEPEGHELQQLGTEVDGANCFPVDEGDMVPIMKPRVGKVMRRHCKYLTIIISLLIVVFTVVFMFLFI